MSLSTLITQVENLAPVVEKVASIGSSHVDAVEKLTELVPALETAIADLRDLVADLKPATPAAPQPVAPPAAEKAPPAVPTTLERLLAEAHAAKPLSDLAQFAEPVNPAISATPAAANDEFAYRPGVAVPVVAVAPPLPDPAQ